MVEIAKLLGIIMIISFFLFDRKGYKIQAAIMVVLAAFLLFAVGLRETLDGTGGTYDLIIGALVLPVALLRLITKILNRRQ